MEKKGKLDKSQSSSLQLKVKTCQLGRGLIVPRKLIFHGPRGHTGSEALVFPLCGIFRKYGFPFPVHLPILLSLVLLHSTQWLNGGSPKRYIHVLILELVNVTLFGKMVFEDIIKLETLNEIILDLEWALNPMTGILIRERQREI